MSKNIDKAKDRALEAFPIAMIEPEGELDIPAYDRNALERNAFIKGYHKAEEDYNARFFKK